MNPMKPRADENEMEVTEIQADLARAKKRGIERREAPPITVNERFNDPRWALAERSKPAGYVLTNTLNPQKQVPTGKTGPKDARWKAVPAAKATHVPFFGDRGLHNDYINKGYEPAVFKGEQVKDQSGDPLYFIPVDIRALDVGEGVALAKARQTKQKKAEAAQGVVEIDDK